MQNLDRRLQSLHTSPHMSWLSGRERAAEMNTALKSRVAALAVQPTLAVLLVGNDPASALYVRLKERAAADTGIRTIIHRVGATTTQEAVDLISAWNIDPSIHGILVQLPLPSSLDSEAIIQAIDPKKDVDSFHPMNREALLRGEGSIFSPVHLAVLTLLGMSPLDMNGAKTLVLAKSPVFRDPLVHLLKKVGAFVDAEEQVPSPAVLSRYAAIITALGQREAFTGTDLADEAVVIDISTNTSPSGKTVGDLPADTVKPTQFVSPVPGGVGPLTIAFLLQNTVNAAEQTTHR